jgi:hypothetical protein
MNRRQFMKSLAGGLGFFAGAAGVADGAMQGATGLGKGACRPPSVWDQKPGETVTLPNGWTRTMVKAAGPIRAGQMVSIGQDGLAYGIPQQMIVYTMDAFDPDSFHKHVLQNSEGIIRIFREAHVP